MEKIIVVEGDVVLELKAPLGMDYEEWKKETLGYTMMVTPETPIRDGSNDVTPEPHEIVHIETEPEPTPEPYEVEVPGLKGARLYTGPWPTSVNLKWDAATETVVSNDSQDLKEYKDAQYEAIREEFRTTQVEPVETSHGIFNGGQESAKLISDAIDLAQKLNEPDVVLTDYDNVPTKFSYGDAYDIAVAIGKKARDAFYYKQVQMRYIADLKEIPKK